MAGDVFVSYSQPDREHAFHLVDHLEAKGIDVWIAPRDVSPSADWAAEIIDAIAAARIMILILSAHSNESSQVRREVERAVHKGVPVLPFRIQDVLPCKSLEYFLSTQHWMDAFPPPYQPHFERVSAYLQARLASDRGIVAGPKSDADAAGGRTAPQFPPAAGAGLRADSAALRQLESALAQYIGPLAAHLVRRASAGSSTAAQLVSGLAGEIDDEASRQKFMSAACHALGIELPMPPKDQR